MRWLAVIVIVWCAGCGSVVVPIDAHEGLDGGDGGPSCDVIDTTCPDEEPAEGGRCTEGLTCRYERALCAEPQPIVCTAGRWSYASIAASCVPPTSETCRAPETTALAGDVTLRVDGDAFVWGPQGLPMIPVVMELTGEAANRACLSVDRTLRIDGVEDDEVRPLAQRARCGLARSLWIVGSPTSALPCADRAYAIELSVDVAGIGSASASASLRRGETTACD